MKLRKTRILVLSATTGVLALSITACQDPEYKAKQAVREGRLEEFMMELSEVEMGRPARLEADRLLYEELEAEHARQLEKTLKRIEESYLEDQQDWLEQKPIREEKVHDILGGNPGGIPDTWAKMVY